MSPVKPVIICVDDEKDTLDALKRLFRKNFDVHTFTAGREALDFMKKLDEVSVIISDQRMPTMLGVEFLEKSRALFPDSVRILLTGYTDIESAILAINSGNVYRYLAKPWDPNDLLATTKEAADKWLTKRELSLKTQQLEIAYSQLKQLDQAKSDFMILINHELKTPLTSISSFLELLQETALDSEQLKYIKRINEGKDRLMLMIQEILLLMQSQTGQLEMNLKNFDIMEPLKKCLDSSHTQLGKQIANTKPLKIFADKSLVEMIFNELVDNMNKHSNSKAPATIEVATEGKNFSITLSNSSEPLSDVQLIEIAKPFRQSEEIFHHSTGLGLGLPLAKSLCELQGLKLTLKYQDGSFMAIISNLPDSEKNK